MKRIKPEDAPVQPGPRTSTKWLPLKEALLAGDAVCISPDEFTTEHNARASIKVNADRWGFKVTVRKDSKTGDLYVFRLPDEGEQD
jgi:hypothetical protein